MKDVVFMGFTVNGHAAWLIILVTFLISFFTVPIAKKLAFHVDAVDYPNKRRLNQVPMPDLGGLAVFIAFLVGYMIFGQGNVQMLSILMGSFLMVLMGMCDDIKALGAKWQLVVQFFAACIVVFYGHITLDDVSILGFNFYFSAPWNYLITILFIVTIINTINLSDGLDGLCSGISTIYFMTISIIAIILNRAGGLDIILALIMSGSILGFLVHNFPPAKIYLGDTGSNFIGFMVAIIALLGFKTATFTSLIIPLIILATPLLDVVFSIIRRSIQKQNPFTTPDKEHFHHQLLKMQFSTRTSLLIIYAINILFALVSVLYAIGDTDYAIALYICLMVLFLFIVLKTDILFQHKKDEKNEK